MSSLKKPIKRDYTSQALNTNSQDPVLYAKALANLEKVKEKENGKDLKFVPVKGMKKTWVVKDKSFIGEVNAVENVKQTAIGRTKNHTPTNFNKIPEVKTN